MAVSCRTIGQRTWSQTSHDGRANSETWSLSWGLATLWSFAQTGSKRWGIIYEIETDDNYVGIWYGCSVVIPIGIFLKSDLPCKNHICELNFPWRSYVIINVIGYPFLNILLRLQPSSLRRINFTLDFQASCNYFSNYLLWIAYLIFFYLRSYTKNLLKSNLGPRVAFGAGSSATSQNLKWYTKMKIVNNPADKLEAE